MRKVSLQTIMLLIACFALQCASPEESRAERTANSFDEVQSEALRLAEVAGGAEHVLLVFDIDNTLLAMNQDLGSDQWFNWQRTLSADDPRCVGDFPELLRIQGLLYTLGSMRPTEPGRQPEIVLQLKDAGFTTLLHTSRGYDFRDATRRELLANEYDLRDTCLSPREGFGGPYYPYDVNAVDQSGITTEEASLWLTDSGSPGEIESPRRVSYNEGVYMTAGQHKGAMLRMLLHKSGNVGTFEHILFVDDSESNTKAVRDAFEHHPVNAVTFRYTREDANVRRFQANENCEHQCAAEALAKMKRAWATTNVSRANRPHAPSAPQVPAMAAPQTQP